MTAREILAKLRELNVKIGSSGDSLKIDAPKGVLGPELISELRARKQEILELLSAGARASGEIAATRRASNAEFPLSLAQHSFFMLDQLEPGSRAYNLFSVRRVRGPLDVAAMREALGRLVERHESLRTTFEMRGRAGAQRVHAAGEVPLSVADLSSLPEHEREAALAEAISRRHAPAFVLAKLPLFRMQLIRLSREDHVLILSMHHIISDAVSLDLFYAELLEAYQAVLAGRAPDAAALPLQYADFARWQQEEFGQSADFQRQLDFWRSTLRGIPSLLEALGGKGSGTSARALTVKTELTAAFSERLRKWAAELKVTPFSVLLTAYQILLSRYSGIRDIPVIVPVSGRARVQLEKLIGLFVNGLVVRKEFQDDMRVVEAVEGVARQTAQALSNADLSVESLERLFRIHGYTDVPLSGLSRIAFNYIPRASAGSRKLGDVTVEAIEVERDETAFELMVIVTETDGIFRIKCEYHAALFEPAYMERFTADLARLIETLCARPQARLGEIRICDESDAVQALGLDREQFSLARPVCERARSLSALIAGDDHGHRRVLGYTVPLRESGDADRASTAARTLAEGNELLRSGVVAATAKYLGGDQQCVAVVAPRVEVVDSAEPVAAVVSQYARQISARGADPRSVSAVVHASDGDYFLFLINEALMSEADVAGHYGELERSVRQALRPATGRLQSNSTTCSEADAQESAPPLLVAVEANASDAGPASAALVIDGDAYERVRRWCAGRQHETADYFAFLFGFVAALSAGHTKPFSIAFRGADLRLRAVAFPEDLTTSKESITALLESLVKRAYPHNAVQNLPPGPAYIFEQVTSDLPAESRVACATDGNIYLRFEHAEDAIRLELCWNGSAADVSFLRRMKLVSDQFVDMSVAPAELDLLLPEELSQWAAIQRDAVRAYDDRGECVHDMVLGAAAQAGDRPAIVSAGRALTYAEVARLSEEIASAIAAMTGPGKRVIGVCLSRSEMLPVVLLGIWRAGHAYLPLDADFPADRLAYLVEKTRTDLVITEQSLEGRLPSGDYRRVFLDDLRAAGQDTKVALPRVDARDLAYVMFTSGSTGRPKGVSIRHASVVNFLRSMTEVPGCGPADTLLAVTTMAFDISVLEMFLPLVNGARLVMTPADAARNAQALSMLLDSENVTILQATPMTWRMLIEYGWTGRHLRALCGGEALNPVLARQILERTGELWNLYGPTETTVWSTLYRVCPEDETMPVGKPIANTQVLVLDQAGRFVPPGVAGELYIGGAGVSAGYFDEPGLTADRFVTLSTPWGDQGIAYKTGDLVTLRHDGQLGFLGRADRQVKLRGYRVELSEIETCLQHYPGVRQVVVRALNGPGGEYLAAYIVPDGACPTDGELREFARRSLPSYMLPQRFVELQSLPLTPNGKVDYAALPEPTSHATVEAAGPRNDTEAKIYTLWAEALGHHTFGIHDSFFEVGGHSLLLVQMHRRICGEFQVSIPVVDLFAHPTIAAQAARIGGEPEATRPQPATASRRKIASGAIAIVGMAGRMPGARDLAQFWANLTEGVESIRTLSEDELRAEGVPDALLKNPRYIRAAGVIEDIELFDAAFFGFSPREAALLDPQQRVLLECAYHAIEDAGYDPFSLPGRAGVFVGIGYGSYLVNNILSDTQALGGMSPLEVMYANERDYAATQISYKLNLTGPSLTVATACSTGLVAVHYACRSLLEGECDFAVAGASKVSVPQNVGYIYMDGAVFSKDGHCRPFDESASGTVFGSGAGVVALRRLEDAIENGDPIYAVVRGTAVNNDGSAKAGYTAPGVAGQSEVISEAYRVAGIDPASTTYVEAHGTGTVLGDPIEISALSQVFGDGENRPGPCYIGSVKGNIGHLDTAAGIAGLVKTALALHHGAIPPSIHCQTLNSRIRFDSSPFRVNRQLTEWPQTGEPARAGVSSFGIGGTNAHVVLESAPKPAHDAGDERPALIVCSGKSETALRANMAAIAERLQNAAGESLQNIAFTLQTGRPSFAFRQAVAASSAHDAAQLLLELKDRSRSTSANSAPPDLVFLFPGQGSESSGMMSSVYRDYPVFRTAFDECCEVASQCGLAEDLRRLVFEGGDALHQTSFTQPALFAVEYALARLLFSWGLKPKFMLGHSLGEYVAACVSGALTALDAMALVVERGRLMQGAAEGKMAAVVASADTVARHLAGGCSISAWNAPDVTVIAGTPEAVDATLRNLDREAVRYQALPSRRAFHTPMMEPILDALRAAAARVGVRPPDIPFLSNVTGEIAGFEMIREPDYWARHAASPVRFLDSLRWLCQKPPVMFVEVGPGRALSSLARRVIGDQRHMIVECAPNARDGAAHSESLLRCLGQIWMHGHSVSWAALHEGERRRRVHLPGYRFERSKYWIDGGQSRIPSPPTPAASERCPIEEWSYEPSWKRKSLAGTASGPATVLLFAEHDARSQECARRIADFGNRVVTVRPGKSFRISEDGCSVELDPGEAGHYDTLMGTLLTQNIEQLAVAHMWGVGDAPDRVCFDSLLCLAQAAARAGWRRGLNVVVATTHGQVVLGADPITADRALVAGPVQVLPREYDGVRCAHIDFEADVDGRILGDSISAELAAGLPETVIAYRKGARWVRVFEPCPMPLSAGQPGAGAWVITGGLGGVGAAVALHAHEKYGAPVVLIGRTPREKIVSGPAYERLRELEKRGATYAYFAADVRDPEQTGFVLSEAEKRYGAIAVVIHAAGVADGGFAQFKKAADIDAVFGPKVDGGRALITACAAHRVRKLVLCSSITAFAGEVGQLAYCSANAFLDALAENARREGVAAYSINWDTWGETGMAVDAQVPKALEQQRQERLRLGLRNSEAMDILDRVLSGPPRQWVISTTPIGQRLSSAGLRLTDEAGSQAHERPALPNALEAPGNETEQRLVAIWRASFALNEVGVTDDFFDLSGTSLQAIQLISEIEREFRVNLDPDLLLQNRTIRALANLIDGRRNGAPRDHDIVVLLQEGTAGEPPLILVHPVGGHLYAYRDLVQTLGASRRIYGIRSPELSLGESLFASVETLAAHYLDKVRGIQAKGPYYLAGSSFGGTVAYEMAQQLKRAGEEVALLALLDTPGGDQVKGEFRKDSEILAYLAAELGPDAGVSREDLDQYDGDACLDYFLDRIGRGGVQITGLDRTRLSAILRTFRLNMQAMKRYQPAEYDGPLHFLKALERRAHDPERPETAWTKVARRAAVWPVPGNHITMHAPPNVRAVAAVLDRLLAGSIAVGQAN